MTDKKEISISCLPLGWSFAAITKNYYGALSKRLESLGIDRHFSILAVIDKTPEKCTQQYLADFLQIDKVSMVRMLDYLFEVGLIERQVNKRDRREHIIQLTRKGRNLMPRIHAGVAEMNTIALKGFTKKEKELLYRCLAGIMANVEGLPINTVDIKLKKKRK